MSFRTKKALSPTALTIILIAVTATVGLVGFNPTETEEQQITDYMWAPDSSHENTPVSNFRIEAVSINQVQSAHTVAAEYTLMSEDSTVFETSDTPKILMNYGNSNLETYYYYTLVAQVKQYQAEIATRKASFFNSSGLEKEEVDAETRRVLGAVDLPVTFQVRKTGNYWEATQVDIQRVAFGGSGGTGGVSGSDGGAVLNAAINAASVAGGGKVMIGSGILLAYQITPRSDVDVCGEGEDTVLRQNANANTIFICSGEKIVNFSMHDLTIDYNHQNQTMGFYEGMYIGKQSEQIKIHDVLIKNCKGFGIHLASDNQPAEHPKSCENCVVENITFLDILSANNDLCVVASHGGYIRNVTILGLHRNAGVVAFESKNLQVIDCYVTVEGQDGYIVGCIWLGSCEDSLCANNMVFGQMRDSSIYETIGIRVNKEHDNTYPRASYKNLVTDNCVSTIKHGIMLEETSDDDIVLNTLTDCNNGVVFPSYGNPAAVNSKIVLNSLNNVTNPIRAFVTPIGMKQYFNDGVSTAYTP